MLLLLIFIRSALTIGISWHIFCLPIFNIHIVCNYLIQILFVIIIFLFVSFSYFSSICLHWERRQAGAGADTWDILTYICLPLYMFVTLYVCNYLISILLVIIWYIYVLSLLCSLLYLFVRFHWLVCLWEDGGLMQ